MNSTMQLLAACLSTPLRAISYSEWIQKLEDTSPESLLRLLPMLREKICDGKSRWELWDKMPVYDTSNLDRALEETKGKDGKSGVVVEWPVLNEELMRKYVTFLTREA